VPSFDHLRAELTLAAPANTDDLARLRRELGAQLPPDYLAFLEAHDGAEGAVGELSPAADVGRAEELYPKLGHLAGLVVFGSDGGLEAFAFGPDGQVLVVPWIGSATNAIDSTRHILRVRVTPRREEPLRRASLTAASSWSAPATAGVAVHP
jgi:hypothetical protein